jgi:hypothetical protein
MQLENKSEKPLNALYYYTEPASAKDGDRTSRHETFAEVVAELLGARIYGGYLDYIDPDKLSERVGLAGLLRCLSKNKTDYVIVPFDNMLDDGEEIVFSEVAKKIEQTGAKLITITKETKDEMLDEACYEAYFTA